MYRERMTTCIDCGAPLDRRGRRGPLPKRCEACAKAARSARQSAGNEQRAAAQRRRYADGYRPPRRIPSEAEREAARQRVAQWRTENPERVRLNNSAQGLVARARARGAVIVEAFPAVEIFERDGYVCQLCDLPTEPGSKMFQPSVDHRIPIARGGEHSRANAQTAHLICNIRKGDS